MISLNDAGVNYLREKLMDHGSPSVVANLDAMLPRWITDAKNTKSLCDQDEDCTLEIKGRDSRTGNPYLIRLHDEHFDFGFLRRLSDNSVIGPATFAQLCASDEASEHDNGVGAFRAEIDGKQVSVFVAE